MLKSHLFRAFREWCQDNGEYEYQQKSKKWLTYKLKAQGIKSDGDGNLSYVGLNLRGKNAILSQ